MEQKEGLGRQLSGEEQLLLKHEELGSNLEYPHEKPSMIMVAVLLEAEAGGLMWLDVYQPNSRFSE